MSQASMSGRKVKVADSGRTMLNAAWEDVRTQAVLIRHLVMGAILSEADSLLPTPPLPSTTHLPLR